MAKNTDKTRVVVNETTDVLPNEVAPVEVMAKTDAKPIETPKINIEIGLGSALLVRTNDTNDYMVVRTHSLKNEPYRSMLRNGDWEVADQKEHRIQTKFSITVAAPKAGCKNC